MISLKQIVQQGSCEGILCSNCYFYDNRQFIAQNLGHYTFCRIRNQQNHVLTNEEKFGFAKLELQKLRIKKLNRINGN